MADSNALPEAGTSNLPDCSIDEDGEVKPHQDPKNGSKTQITTASLILLKFMVVFLASNISDIEHGNGYGLQIYQHSSSQTW